MIRLLLAVATACAVVWAVGGELRLPSQDAVERTARVLREEAVELLAAREAEAPQPQLVEAAPEATRGLAPAEKVREPVDFAPEAPVAAQPDPASPVSEDSIAASRGWDAPLDAVQAEAVRGRLDRVMSLAAGNAE